MKTLGRGKTKRERGRGRVVEKKALEGAVIEWRE